MSQEQVVRDFFQSLGRAQFSEAKSFMENQRSLFLSYVWPKSLFDILCDFALAEKNYSDTNFEPSKSKTVVRKEDENYLKVVYNKLFQDLEVILDEVHDDFVLLMINSIMNYITVRLKLLELYDKLYEVGSTYNLINFSELSLMFEKIQIKFSLESPIWGIMKILRYELGGLKHLFKCHEHLERWLYLESLLSLKKGCDAILLWDKNYKFNSGWTLTNFFSSKITTPPIVVWFKKFKYITISKFTLYFYSILLQGIPFQELRAVCYDYNIHIFTKMQLLQKKSEAQAVLLVLDTSELDEFKGHNYWSPVRNVVDPDINYHIMLSYPKVPVKLDVLETLIAENNKEEKIINKIVLVAFDCVGFLITSVDWRVTLIMFYDCKPKNEEREKANTYEFISQIQCHKLFLTINK